MISSRLNDLKQRDRKGSRARCILLTEGPRDVVANRLTGLTNNVATVRPDRHSWMPRGFDNPEEARLGDTSELLCEEVRECVTAWWLAVRHRMANTPNWDIASTATIGGREGLLLVEAKAHANEISAEGKVRLAYSNAENHARIDLCCRDAGTALNKIVPGWSLSAESHYQLCNRFAWAWKLASLRIPVVLVYLGFLHADEMPAPLESADQWDDLVRSHGRGIVPPGAWNGELLMDGTSLRAMIRSMRVDLDA
jgi:hypothetical protein